MRRRIGEAWSAVVGVGPTLAAGAAIAAGLLLIISGAAPTRPERLQAAQAVFAPGLINLAHFASSLIGLLLLLLAFGLRRRLDAAWAAAALLAGVAAALAVIKGWRWEQAVLLATAAGLIVVLRPAFDRRAELTRVTLTPGWLFAAATLTTGAALLGRWLFENAAYADAAVWRVLIDAEAARANRAAMGAALLLLLAGVWLLVATPAAPRVAGDSDPDFARVRAALAAAEHAPPDANLALLGDKRFLFSNTGRSFIMFGVRDRSWIALGMPVGLRAERRELLWRFRELADANAARPAFYDIGPEDLPDVVELGFVIQKIGEAAAVPLRDFSLRGRGRSVLRRRWRKGLEAGLVFEVVPPTGVPALLPELRAVSDAWMRGQPGGEKGFSLGGFVERYLCEFPCAVVRWGGAVVAFANIWTSSDGSALSVDLMRYAPEAPKGVMDVLFVELMLWGQARGFQAFEFGVAPLAGLEPRRLAPATTRLGRAVYERGENFYNFRGVRLYKEKFDPVWEPRYVAAPKAWHIPWVLADVGLLSSGGLAAGLAGLARRPGRAAQPELEPERLAGETPTLATEASTR